MSNMTGSVDVLFYNTTTLTQTLSHEFCLSLLNMKAATLAAVITMGSVGASFVENDALAAEALAKLTTNVAQHGYPNAEECTLDNVAVRKE
jgi:hypothetical protein